jgi:hypothetical protein
MTGVIEVSRREIVAPYPDAAAELAEHLLRLNGLLRGAVDRFRRQYPDGSRNGLDGIAIFDEQVDRFLDTPPNPDSTALDNAAADRLCCHARARVSMAAGVACPIATIQQRFGLSDLELDALLYGIAAELHPGYGRVFGYLHNDLARQRPSVALLVDVLAAGWSERLEARRVLGPGSPLWRSRLLTGAAGGADHLTAALTVDPMVLDFVLGGVGAEDDYDPALEPTLDDLLIATAERQALERTARYLRDSVAGLLGPVIIVLSGAPGVGRRSAARAICRILGYRMRSTTKGKPKDAPLAGLVDWLRNTRLAGEVPALYVPPGPIDAAPDLQLFIDAIATADQPFVFLFVESDDPPRLAAITAAQLTKLHLGAPNVGLRRLGWQRALRANGLVCSDVELATVVAVYPFNIGRLTAVAQEAGRRARLADPVAICLESGLLAKICREQSHHRLDHLAQSLPIRHGWDDIILPPDELCRLKEIANAVRNRLHVMERWGFEQKISAGPGVNAIFFGPSGTGKTMAASILAGDLSMEIYRVDLSRVVSKYIGETERNLDTLFEEARRSFAVLFFDEAEALFGKRSEVKDAHDRYANIEVAYLLQRMEAFPGVAILATNLRKHMDTAFLRRLQFAVEFPLPTQAERLRIWQRVWPGAAELGDDIDLGFIAGHLELSGGHIRNVALMAAFLAAEAGAPIGMAHIVAATKREFQKLGRHWAPDQFGRYAALAGLAS